MASFCGHDHASDELRLARCRKSVSHVKEDVLSLLQLRRYFKRMGFICAMAEQLGCSRSGASLFSGTAEHVGCAGSWKYVCRWRSRNELDRWEVSGRTPPIDWEGDAPLPFEPGIRLVNGSETWHTPSEFYSVSCLSERLSTLPEHADW